MPLEEKRGTCVMEAESGSWPVHTESSCLLLWLATSGVHEADTGWLDSLLGLLSFPEAVQKFLQTPTGTALLGTSGVSAPGQGLHYDWEETENKTWPFQLRCWSPGEAQGACRVEWPWEGQEDLWSCAAARGKGISLSHKGNIVYKSPTFLSSGADAGTGFILYS